MMRPILFYPWRINMSLRDVSRLNCSLAAAAVLAGATLLSSQPGLAATDTDDLGVSITITASCAIDSVDEIDFGTETYLTDDVDEAGAINVQCSNQQAYTITLGAGGGSGASDTTTNGRKMTSGSNAISYGLYTDASRTTTWTNGSAGKVTGTGNGTVQSIPVYGRVPGVTTAPAAGTYSDTVAVTITY
jgi:spore coat protein U-like protein